MYVSCAQSINTSWLLYFKKGIKESENMKTKVVGDLDQFRNLFRPPF